jgi:hypothetical protein
MKVAISIAVAIVMPLGFFVLFGVIVNHVLAKRRQQRPARLRHQACQHEAITRGILQRCSFGRSFVLEPAPTQTIS